MGLERAKHFPDDDELSRLALLLIRTFVQRLDIYPKQLEDGSYVSMREPLNPSLLVAHLKGEVTLGTYLLSSDAKGRFLVLDADTAEEWEQLTHIAPALHMEHIPCVLERSRRGGHLWIFFTGWLVAQDIRLFAKGILAAYQIGSMEIYPKQDQLTTGPGSLIRLPFGVHLKSGKRYGFYSPQGMALAPTLRKQAQVLSRVPKVTAERFSHYRSVGLAATEKAVSGASDHPEKPIVQATKGDERPVSERIKDAISVWDFIEHFAPEVQLTHTGRGFCPFHDDDTRSFGVHREGNFWSCFAGCGGGSIIDFWMRYQERQGLDASFAATVKDLAAKLL